MPAFGAVLGLGSQALLLAAKTQSQEQRTGVSALYKPTSVLAGDPIEHDLADHFESHTAIEFNGAMVRAANVKPRHQSVATMISHQLPDKARSQTLAAMGGMCADAADLGISVEH